MSLFVRAGHRITVTESGSAPSDLGQTAYDAEGRVIATWGATYPVAYDYDEFGRMISLHTWRDENGFDASSEHGFSNPSESVHL